MQSVDYGEPVVMVPAIRVRWRAGGVLRDTTFVIVDGRAVPLDAIDARWYADKFPD